MVELDRLRQVSARVGADPSLVQAAGGNTSLKQDGVMWIKASGTWLKDAASRDIFVPVDHAALMAALAKNDPACESCTDFLRRDLNASGLRPSIETTVHALMPQEVVIHVHCVNTIAWAILADAEAQMRSRMKPFDWAFIPYARPGLPLAGAIQKRMRPGVDVLVLGNHGLVVAGETVIEAEERLAAVVAALRRETREASPIDAAKLATACEGSGYRPAEDPETHALATDSLALQRGRTEVFYPDHVVFLGVGVETEMKSGAPLVALPGLGVVVKQDAKPAAEPMGRCLADVMRRIQPSEKLVSLTAEDIDRLVNWDAEKYRQTLKT